MACVIAGIAAIALFVFVALVSRWWTSWLWVAVLVPYTGVQWARYRRLKPPS
jgi:hypothetical protein